MRIVEEPTLSAVAIGSAVVALVALALAVGAQLRLARIRRDFGALAGDGIVISSIHARSESRTYAKGIVSGRSSITLSPEEQQAPDPESAERPHDRVSTGRPAFFQASNPPSRTRTFGNPYSTRSRAALSPEPVSRP